jgi:hypothetical protein
MIGSFRLNGISAQLGISLTSLTFVSSQQITGPTNYTSPSFSNNIGDIIVYINTGYTNSGSFPPTAVTPTGFTNVINNATSGINGFATRTLVSYQIATTSRSSQTITGMTSNGNEHIVFVYRPNGTATSVSFGTPNIGAIASGTAQPNQTLTFGTMTNLMVGFANGSSSSSSGSNGSSWCGSTTTPTRTIDSVLGGSTYYGRTMTFEGSGFSGTTTISQSSTTGVRMLQSWIMTVS